MADADSPTREDLDSPTREDLDGALTDLWLAARMARRHIRDGCLWDLACEDALDEALANAEGLMVRFQRED